MNLKELFEMQKKLDEHIVKEKGLEGQDLLPQKILALRVELGELANETRYFKFWSNKGPSKKKIILEEYVDCLHFILSICIDVDFQINQYNFDPYIQDPNNICEQFNACFSCISKLEDTDFEEEVVEYLIKNFLGLGQMLAFEENEITNAYLKKNQVNHQRQENGY